MTELTLTGKNAIVTGGASGIGLACAQILASRGAHVTIADIDAEAAAEAAGKIDGSTWAVDLSATEALDDLGLDADILVNNAGIQRISAIEDFDPDAFRRIQRIMLEAPFLLIRAALPHMYGTKWGRIINISSVHGLRASPFKVAYVAAKHGLEGISKVTALEGGPHGVTSNCVNPGYVQTPLVDKQIADQAKIHDIEKDEVIGKIMTTESAIKSLVQPEEVASMVAWLCSPDARMVTGTSFSMDGGWTAR